MSEAADKVREAIAAKRPPDRKALEHALRECFGMTARQAKRFASQGTRALGVDDEAEEMEERLAALEKALRI